MVWHFIGVYIINRTLHDRLEIRNFSSRVEKYFSTLEEKFRISARPCNILYLSVPIASKYKDTPDNRAKKSSQYRSTRAGASWSVQGTPECSSSPLKGKGRGPTRQTAAKKSPVDRSRFLSTAERVTNSSQVANNS